MSYKIHYTRKTVKKFLEDRFPDTDWSEVIEELPPIIWRARWDRLAEKHGLPYSRGYLQNLDSNGIGPNSFAKTK